MSSQTKVKLSTRIRWFFQSRSSTGERGISLGSQLLSQLFLVIVTATVLYPILWVVSMSFDPRDISRPTQLRLNPFSGGLSLKAYADVIKQPTANPVGLAQLSWNSFRLATLTGIAAILVGVFASYAFSRLRFAGRQQLMIAVLTVLMLPSIATLPALFVLLNKITITIGGQTFNLRNSLLGVGLAILSGSLPFAIWNMKGYLDTIPKELEEAALIDGCTPNTAFFLVTLPLSTPVLAVTFFLGFMSTWTEFATSWLFLTEAKNFTLMMALYNMVGQYSNTTPWSHFAALSILIALPVVIIYLFVQRWFVGGLAIGGVKG
ncbi:MAG: ABC transporter permease subunit [Anaerolineales bacterium]|jgi:arabinogalactan oligomer/maltooligosaccharide transport system permease protein